MRALLPFVVVAGPLALLVCTFAQPAIGAPELVAERETRASSASVVVPARPREVFATLSDPLAWPRVLTDVTQVERDQGEARSWRIVSKLMGHAHLIELTLKRDALVHFHVSDPGPGGALDVDIALEQVSPGSTRISYTMRTVLPLGLGAVIDDDPVRRGREQKILRDLTDIERHFSGGKNARP